MLLLFHSRIINATLFKPLSDSQSFSRALVNQMANQFTRSWLRMEVAGCSPGRSERARLYIVAGFSTAPTRHRMFPVPLDGRSESLDIWSPSPSVDFRRSHFVQCSCFLVQFPVLFKCPLPSFGHLGAFAFLTL